MSGRRADVRDVDLPPRLDQVVGRTQSLDRVLLLPAALIGDDPAGLRGDVTAALDGDAAARMVTVRG
ncbi:MAG: hypothetical protein ACYC36_16215 [Bellilinea sp.]